MTQVIKERMSTVKQAAIELLAAVLIVLPDWAALSLLVAAFVIVAAITAGVI